MLDAFSFSLSGHTLTFTGGSLTLTDLPTGHIVASAAVGGGVQLSVKRPAHNDFNGDGVSDVLLQTTMARCTDWLGQAPNGNFIGNIDKVNILTGPEWHVIGTGDFNGDGYVDVLWQHDNGTVPRLARPAPTAASPANVTRVNIRPTELEGRSVPATSTATGAPTSCGRTPTAPSATGSARPTAASPAMSTRSTS